ncbi:hypothetical protein BGW39_008223 [Mortierella sp. 14UC]|nr:hypothetical protein BGW39_008223 [Mortierella sp. 14UC]
MDKAGQGVALFAFGSNGNGQLGIASDDDTSTPQPVHLTATGGVSSTVLQFHPSQHNIKGNDNDDDEERKQAYFNATTPFHDFAAGGNHTAFITHGSRQLFMTGSNKDGETLLQEPSQVFKSSDLSGLLRPPPQRQQLNKVEGQESISPPADKDKDDSKNGIRWRSVACGWAFTIGLTEPYPAPDSHDTIAACLSNTTPDNNQTLYAWGSGSFGELGLGPGRSKTGGQAIAITTGLLDHSNTTRGRFELVKVRAGLRHVLLLAKETRSHLDNQDNSEATRTRTVLMGWGSNRQGQLGVLTRSGVLLSEKELRGKFMEPTRIVISPGPRSTSVDRRDNNNDELEIVDMACGQNHSLVLFTNGTVYSSGLDKYGQLGPRATADIDKEAEKGKTVDFRIGFEQVIGLPFVDSISCGWSHNAAMDKRPFVDPTAMTTIYLWGRNDHGQLGGGVPLRALNVGLTGGLEGAPVGIVQVRIPARRKGGGEDRMVESEEEYEQLVSYSCGSEHTLAMTRSSACYAWGWNEHGNCGGGVDGAGNKDLQDVPSPRPIQFPTLSSSPSQGWVVGGYGSSWVWT